MAPRIKTRIAFDGQVHDMVPSTGSLCLLINWDEVSNAINNKAGITIVEQPASVSPGGEIHPLFYPQIFPLRQTPQKDPQHYQSYCRHSFSASVISLLLQVFLNPSAAMPLAAVRLVMLFVLYQRCVHPALFIIVCAFYKTGFVFLYCGFAIQVMLERSFFCLPCNIPHWSC